MKTVFIAALAVLSAGSAMAQTQSAPPQGGPATNVPVLEGAVAAPDCGALSVPADQAFCVTAPLAGLGAVGEAYIALFQAEGWQVAAGGENYVLFARRTSETQCEGLQMLAFYDQTRPDSPTAPGYLGFGAVPTMPCQPATAAAPAAQ
ncbi:MAG TPA: hypothetical protein VGE54_00940 [Brevundimonas sp.]